MDNEEYCINTLVLTSRVSLANTLSKTLDLSLYTNNKKHCLDSVYSIESCDKVIDEINFYDEEDKEDNKYDKKKRSLNKVGENHRLLLVIDEIAGFLNHLESTTIKERQHKIRIISRMFRKAHYIVILDADILNIHLKFLCNIMKEKQIYLFHNVNIKKVDYDTKIFLCQEMIIDEIINKILQGEKVYICSDSRKKIDMIRKDLKKKIDKFEETTKVYTKDLGFVTDFNNVNEIWQNYNIMVSPKVIYGIDYNIKNTHHVYGFFNDSSDIDVILDYQQISRVRQPKSLNIYIKQKLSKFKIFNDINNKELNNLIINNPEFNILDDEEKAKKIEEYKRVAKILTKNKMKENNKFIDYDELAISYVNEIDEYENYEYDIEDLKFMN